MHFHRTASLIVGTSAALARRMDCINFEVAVFDEGSNAPDVKILSVISKGPEQLIIRGDPQQLPPTTLVGSKLTKEIMSVPAMTRLSCMMKPEARKPTFEG